MPELEQSSALGLEQRRAKVEGSGAVTSMEMILQGRVRELDKYLYESLPRNRSDREKLLECGYSPKLWDEVICYECTVVCVIQEAVEAYEI